MTQEEILTAALAANGKKEGGYGNAHTAPVTRTLIDMAREKGIEAYLAPMDQNRWLLMVNGGGFGIAGSRREQHIKLAQVIAHWDTEPSAPSLAM